MTVSSEARRGEASARERDAQRGHKPAHDRLDLEPKQIGLHQLNPGGVAQSLEGWHGNGRVVVPRWPLLPTA